MYTCTCIQYQHILVMYRSEQYYIYQHVNYITESTLAQH